MLILVLKCTTRVWKHFKHTLYSTRLHGDGTSSETAYKCIIVRISQCYSWSGITRTIWYNTLTWCFFPKNSVRLWVNALETSHERKIRTVCYIVFYESRKLKLKRQLGSGVNNTLFTHRAIGAESRWPSWTFIIQILCISCVLFLN